jgi:hypothetical protein
MHAKKAYGKVEVHLHSFLTSILDGDAWYSVIPQMPYTWGKKI